MRRPVARSRLAVGTLACPGATRLSRRPAARAPPTAGLPVLRPAAAVRDFLSPGNPARPARVEVRVVRR